MVSDKNCVEILLQEIFITIANGREVVIFVVVFNGIVQEKFEPSRLLMIRRCRMPSSSNKRILYTPI